MEMDKIIVALIGLVGVLGTAIIGHLSKKKETRKTKMVENELKMQAAAMDFTSFLQEWDAVVAELENLMASSNVDRFLILRAWNGYLTPRWTTAVFQYRKGRQAPVSYVHFELDEDYVQRLRTMSSGSMCIFNTSELPDGAVKRIYEVEKVEASLWIHLASVKMDGDSTAITYCSFSSHEGVIDQDTATRCKIIADRLKGVSMSFHNA